MRTCCICLKDFPLEDMWTFVCTFNGADCDHHHACKPCWDDGLSSNPNVKDVTECTCGECVEEPAVTV